MLARFTNKPLALALIAGAVLSIIFFAAFHRMTGGERDGLAQAVVSAANPVVAHFTMMQPTTVGRVAVANAPLMAAGRPVTETALMPAPRPKTIAPRPRGARGPSQLIRTANLSIEVTDVSKSLRAATSITEGQLGDVIGLNDETPASENAVHTGTMSIRVPQYRFEQTLDALGTLGKVRSKSVNAQDVSDQLVDAQARLRNLRRTETDILNIMDRSGNIEQVLNVTQQLGSVREQIEQLDAQIQGMQYQVAYSTINITFTSPVVVNIPTGFAVLAEAWKSALGSLRDFTVSLLSVGLWLLAFSPYIIVLALIAAFAMHRIRSHALTTRGG
jgi:hypothetical protein